MSNASTASLDRAAAKDAFAFLEQVRANPGGYAASICGADRQCAADLSGGAKPALLWNAILVQVAEAKALDMARRNYLNHVTPEGLGINVLMSQAGYELP